MLVKICGLRSADDIVAAAQAGADLVGLNFSPSSRRFIEPAEAGAIVQLARRRLDQISLGIGVVGLFVDAADDVVDAVAPLIDAAQFHGREQPARIEALVARHGFRSIKALPVSDPDDVAAAAAYAPVVDMMLFDARPPKGATAAGGHGQPFDWRALDAYRGPSPFLLAGGLTPGNVREAVESVARRAHFCGVDVATGVEAAPGVKDPRKILRFVQEARAGLDAAGHGE